MTYLYLCTKAPRRRIGVRARQLDGTDGLQERSARERLSQSQCRVGWSPRVLRTPLGFDLAAPFAFSDRTGSTVVPGGFRGVLFVACLPLVPALLRLPRQHAARAASRWILVGMLLLGVLANVHRCVSTL